MESPDTSAALALPFSDGVWYAPRDRRFKLWYAVVAPAGLSPEQPKGGMMTAYATSADGIRWDKPALDVIPGTNLVQTAPRDSTVVWLDHEAPDPARRFTHLRAYRSADDTPWATSVNFSADGIHRSDTAASTQGLKWFSDRTTAFYNPFRRLWVYGVRNSIRQDPSYCHQAALSLSAPGSLSPASGFPVTPIPATRGRSPLRLTASDGGRAPRGR